MAHKKDWLAMTRHERRGALALVVMAVIVVIAVWFARSRTHQLTPAEQQQVRQFELMADSIQQAADSAKYATKTKEKATKDKTKGKAKTKGKTKGKAKAKSKAVPQRMDPVPQF